MCRKVDSRTVTTMTTRSEYLEELAGIEPFRALWRRDLLEVARSVDVLDIDDGTVIVEGGGAATSCS